MVESEILFADNNWQFYMSKENKDEHLSILLDLWLKKSFTLWDTNKASLLI